MNSTLTVSKLAGFIILIGPMLMYIHILPINAETQPIISALVIIFLFCNKEIYKTEFYMLFLIFYTFAFGFISVNYLGGSFIVLLSYIFGPLLFIATPNRIQISKRIFVATHILLLYILVTQKFNIPFLSDLTDSSIGYVLSRSYSFRNVSYVPVSGFATEASYVAQQIIFLHLLAEIGYEKSILRITRGELKFFRILLLLYLYLTPSASMFSLIMLCYFAISEIYIIILFIISIVIMYIVLENLGIPSIMDILINLKYSDVGWKTLLEIDSNGSSRVYSNIIGYLISLERPFGVGPGNYGLNWDLAFNNYDIDVFKLNWDINQWYKTGHKSSTYLSNYASDIGSIGFAFFIAYLLFTLKYLNRNIHQKSVRNVLIFMFFFACTITSPIPWLLLSLYKKDYRYNLNSLFAKRFS